MRIKLLCEVGFDSGAAATIARHPSCTTEQIWIALDLLLAAVQHGEIKNPLGFVRRAIEQKWAAPRNAKYRQGALWEDAALQRVRHLVQREATGPSSSRENLARAAAKANPLRALAETLSDERQRERKRAQKIQEEETRLLAAVSEEDKSALMAAALETIPQVLRDECIGRGFDRSPTWQGAAVKLLLERSGGRAGASDPAEPRG